MQLIIRLLVLATDIVINLYILATLQAFSQGSNYAWFLVTFNAIVIFLVYAVDFILFKWRKLSAEIKIGERIIEGHVNED